MLLRINEQRNILHEIRKRKANRISHILRRNCLPKQVIEGKIKGEMEVTRRRGRRRKKLLDDLKMCYVMLCYVMLCYVMLCYVMLCYVTLRYVILCYVMLCYVMLCYH